MDAALEIWERGESFGCEIFLVFKGADLLDEPIECAGRREQPPEYTAAGGGGAFRSCQTENVRYLGHLLTGHRGLFFLGVVPDQRHDVLSLVILSFESFVRFLLAKFERLDPALHDGEAHGDSVKDREDVEANQDVENGEGILADLHQVQPCGRRARLQAIEWLAEGEISHHV